MNANDKELFTRADRALPVILSMCNNLIDICRGDVNESCLLKPYIRLPMFPHLSSTFAELDRCVSDLELSLVEMQEPTNCLRDNSITVAECVRDLCSVVVPLFATMELNRTFGLQIKDMGIRIIRYIMQQAGLPCPPTPSRFAGPNCTPLIRSTTISPCRDTDPLRNPARRKRPRSIPPLSYRSD